MSLIFNYYFLAFVIWVVVTILGAMYFAPGLFRDWRRHRQERKEKRSPASNHEESEALKKWGMGS